MYIVKQCANLPTGIYLFKVNSENTRTMCKICSELMIKTSEQRYYYRYGVFVDDFEQCLYALEMNHKFQEIAYTQSYHFE